MRVTPSACVAAIARMGYSSIIDTAFRRHVDLGGPADAKISHAAALGAVVFRDVAAHLLKREDQSGAQRIIPTDGINRSPSVISAATIGNAAERITRHGDVGGPERCSPRAVPSPSIADGRLRQMAEHGWCGRATPSVPERCWCRGLIAASRTADLTRPTQPC